MTMLGLAVAVSPTSSPTPGEGSTNPGSTGTDLKWLIVLAVVVLVGFVVVYVASNVVGNGNGFRRFPTFARVYSLLAIVFVAAALAFASVSDSSRSAAYAVLGAVAGYLAGQKNTTTTVQDPGDQPGGRVTTITEDGL
jgi:drug/metabolite transporter superfamily protein YnfA